MRTYDLSPLYRATVGFDRLASLLDGVNRADEQAFSYPPYNIEKLGEDQYRISMAVAGFAESDLDITVKEGSLVVTGKKAKTESEASGNFLYRGIAQRAFERRFDLADHIKVTGQRPAAHRAGAGDPRDPEAALDQDRGLGQGPAQGDRERPGRLRPRALDDRVT